MTDDQLTGRELDEACAKAMGWRDIGDDADGDPCGLPTGRTAGVYRRRFVPAFSTDAACIPEMLAWLRITFELTEVGVSRDGEVWARGSFDDVDTIDMVEDGSTLSEALAKLVVAVGEAKEKP